MKRVSAGVAATCLVAGMVHAQNSEEEKKTRDCLPMVQIDRVEVVDNQHIIFHMQGDKKYINRLPYSCPGLKNNTLLHETSLNSYCDLDTITVVDTSIGMRLVSCPLGEFQPYTEMDDKQE